MRPSYEKHVDARREYQRRYNSIHRSSRRKLSRKDKAQLQLRRQQELDGERIVYHTSIVRKYPTEDPEWTRSMQVNEEALWDEFYDLVVGRALGDEWMEGVMRPPALRKFTQSRNPQPPLSVIEQQRFKERLHVRKDGNEQIHSNFTLHDHFCLSNDDRKMAYHEALNDIEDAAVGVARLTDAFFIGIAVRPEWDTSVPLEPSSVQVDFILSRQFQQNSSWMQAVSKIRSIIQNELAVPHILAFHRKLDQITPRGHALDPETGRVLNNPVRLAASLSPSLSEHGDASPCTVPSRTSPLSTSCRSLPPAPPPSPPPANVRRERTKRGRLPPARSPPEPRRATRGVQERPHRDNDDTALARLARDLSLSVPATGQPLRSADEPINIWRQDLPPSYEAEYYCRGDVDSLPFGSVVKEFLRTLNLTTHQCARIEAALDYWIDDWVPAFTAVGLKARDAQRLRVLVEAELSAESRDIMRSVASEQLSETSLTVREESSVSNTSRRSVASATSSTTFYSLCKDLQLSDVVRPQRTKEQRAANAQRSDELWDELMAERVAYNASITRIAEKYKQPRKWVAMQLYSSGPLLSSHRAVNSYNAMLHDRSERNKADGVASEGRQTLTNLVQETAADEWDDMDDEERGRLISQLQHTRDKRATAKNVPTKSAAIDVSRVHRSIHPELEALHNRTGAEFMLLILHGDATDNWQIETYASAKAADACSQVFKVTVEVFAARIDGYIVAGLDGVRREMGGRRFNTLKGKVRTTIVERFRDICIRKGFPRDKLPKEMKWAAYEDLVTRYGVKLEGWTEEDGVCNPGGFKSCAPLERLLAALEGPSPSLHWVDLSEDEWNARKEALITAPRKRGKGTGKKGGRHPQSAEEVQTSDDESRCTTPQPSSPVIVPASHSMGSDIDRHDTSTAGTEDPQVSPSTGQAMQAVNESNLMGPDCIEAGLPVPMALDNSMRASPAAAQLMLTPMITAPDAPPPIGSLLHSLLSPIENVPDVPLHQDAFGIAEDVAMPPMLQPGEVGAEVAQSLLSFPSLSGAFSGAGNVSYYLPGAESGQYNPLEIDWTAGMDDQTLGAIAWGRI
ncbi:hypothetical protein CERSUDRAFT_97844 [Gelatoporia subvermispora B]|uniref:Uncharacterized protein n=1 Tax=Ceriporiopsis subvermispora (strain B) TaxID=914234 RepID=M2QP49_CERS8|nr:hypothetical protein CERSUDRAFT_97844 [Gelatoporia subvermispora B]